MFVLQGVKGSDGGLGPAGERGNKVNLLILNTDDSIMTSSLKVCVHVPTRFYTMQGLAGPPGDEGPAGQDGEQVCKSLERKDVIRDNELSGSCLSGWVNVRRKKMKVSELWRVEVVQISSK